MPPGDGVMLRHSIVVPAAEGAEKLGLKRTMSLMRFTFLRHLTGCRELFRDGYPNVCQCTMVERAAWPSAGRRAVGPNSRGRVPAYLLSVNWATLVIPRRKKSAHPVWDRMKRSSTSSGCAATALSRLACRLAAQVSSGRA